MKNIEEFNKRLDLIEKKSSLMKSDVASEQLVYNEELNKFLEEINNYEIFIKKTLNNKIKEVLTKNNESIEELQDETSKLKEILIFNCEEDNYLKESGLDKIIYKISYSKDVDIINKSIKDFIACLEKYDIKLDVTMYDYSYYTLKYMSMFYDNVSDSNFYITMKKYFEEIYWLCPNIIKQLVLNFIDIAFKNKKSIHKSIVSKRNSLINKMNLENENIEDIYFSKLNELYNKRNKDTFYIYEYLSDNSDYLAKISNLKYDELISKYSTKELESSEDEELFIDNINSFQSNLTEYIYLIKYKYILDYELDILKSSTTKVKDNKKELIKLTKKKDKYNKKLIKLNNTKDKYKLISKSSDALDKKIRIYNAYLTSCIDEIYKLTFKNYIEEFNQDIIDNLNENSNTYEALLLASKHYLALSNIIYEKNMDVDIVDEINNIENILYTKDSFISRNTSVEFFDNISSLINKKYLLCNINTSIVYDDYNSIKNTIDEEYFLVLSYNLKMKDLSLKDIEICIMRTQD